jgi:hypothetical protein
MLKRLTETIKPTEQTICKSPRSLALDQLNVQQDLCDSLHVLNNKYLENMNQITLINNKFKDASISLNKTDSSELWEKEYASDIKELEQAKVALDLARQELTAENAKVIYSNYLYRR